MKNIKLKKYIIGVLCLIAACAIFFIRNDKASISTSSNHNLSQSEINKINTNLSIIMSTPSKSSNPGDYIKDHQKEYDEIIQMGEPVVEYFLQQFKKDNENGFNQWMMAWICNEILGDKNPIKIWELDHKNGWDSGRDWYEKYISSKK